LLGKGKREKGKGKRRVGDRDEVLNLDYGVTGVECGVSVDCGEWTVECWSMSHRWGGGGKRLLSQRAFQNFCIC